MTGKLGGSSRRKHLNFVPRIDGSPLAERNTFRIHAMMDLSDGLGADLPRLAAASGVGFAIEEEALPRTRGCSIDAAINDGEDYELLFAISPNDASSLQTNGAGSSRVSHSLASASCFRAAGFELPRSFHGYVHFQ